MLIDQLNIQKFRGISDHLSLDLTAPLTVIYAPNGTGKTSICDALEWLLCGSIGRLTLLDKSEVRCRFGSKDIETFSEAVISHNQRPFSFKRVLVDSGSQLYWKDQLSDYKQSTDQELLRQIVTALPPSGSSNRAKVDWVRSTRFLETESLNLLIDSDDESNDTRKLIFSNLFGVNEYQRSENSLSKILRKLPAQRTIEKEIRKANDKISEFKSLIDKQANDKSEEYKEHIYTLLKTVSKNIERGEQENSELDIEDKYKKLEIALVEYRESIEKKVTSVTFVEMNLSAHEDYVAKIESQKGKIESSTISFDKVTDKQKQERAKLDKLREEHAADSKFLIDLSETLEKLENESNNVDLLIEVFMRPSVDGSEIEARKEKILGVIDQMDRRLGELNNRYPLILQSIENLPLWGQKGDSLKGVQKELNYFESHIPKKDSSSLSEKVSEIKIRLDRVRLSREKALGDLELVITSGRKYVDEHNDVNECPLCDQKYSSNSELKNRIESKFSKLSARSQEEASLAAEHNDLTKQLQNENMLLKQHKELVASKHALTEELSIFEERFMDLGVNKYELSNADLVSKKLDDIRDEHLKQIKEVGGQCKAYRDAKIAYGELENALIRVQSLFYHWSQFLAELNVDPKSIDEIKVSIRALVKVLSEILDKTKKAIESRLLQIDRLSAVIKKLVEDKNKQEEELLGLKKQLDEYLQKYDEIMRRWKDVSDSDVINKEQINKIIERCEDNRNKLNEALALLEKAEEYFYRIREEKKKEQEISVIMKELKTTKVELEEWLNQRDARLTIEKEIQAIQEEVKKFVSREIKPLSSTISTLYLRAQGNRFINSISAEPTERGLLNWIAELDEEGNSFDKMQALSQGQRQDLALSIFLARARGLGGTYFLDEPLAHLDDLNKVALLDTLRVIISEENSVANLRLVLTTASKNLLRHLREKFSLVERHDGSPALRIYKMLGNPKIGLEVEDPEIVRSPNRLLVSE